MPGSLAELLRTLTPGVLGVVVRRHGDFDGAEDAVQEAMLAAAISWPEKGVPANPAGWLVTVASRRWTDRWRQDTARRRRESEVAATPIGANPVAVDDSLTLLTLCCHDCLPPSSQIALTLRAVGGLSTAEIARSLLLPEATVAQRISRAKQRLRDTGATFPGYRPAALADHVDHVDHVGPADHVDPADPLDAVLSVLYLIFNEGSTASAGRHLHRVELSTEAIRLTRQLRSERPRDGEVAGLLALMLLTDARRPARTRPDGTLVPLDEQDRAVWDAAAIEEGDALVTWALSSTPIGPYQLQAAIAAVHDQAGRVQDTDWRQILALYDLLHIVAPGPMVVLNRIVALAMVEGAEAGLDALAAARNDPALRLHHRAIAVQAHLLERSGADEDAAEQYLLAAKRTLNLPEQRYLESRAHRLLTSPIG